MRLLDSGQINKNDPNDARSVAVAALRAHELPELAAEDHAMVMRVWARRYHDLARLRTQVVCRLHAVVCELVPGGVRKYLRASQATDVLDRIVADSPVAQAKLELARELVADLERIDAQRREAKRRTARAVAATRTSINDVYGVGPIVAGTVLGYVRDIRRFATRDRFASYNGTAPIEVSSGDRKIYRLSRRGNRQLNHAIHMAAISQIRHHNSEGRAYYEKKIAEGMTGKTALRALKRKISDALYARMIDDARRLAAKDPGGHTGNDSASSAAGSHPETPALRKSHSRATANSKTGTDQRPLTLRPAPDRRPTSRRAAGVQVEPRPGPHRGRVLEHRCGDQHEHRWSDLARLRPLQFAAPLPGVSPGGFAGLSSVRRCCEPYSAGVEPAGGWPCETAIELGGGAGEPDATIGGPSRIQCRELRSWMSSSPPALQ